MKRFLIILMLLSLAVSMTGCKKTSAERVDIDSIQYYTEIPGITAEEIAAIEALKEKKDSFIYGHLIQTEAFLQPDGTYAGFTIKLCDLLTDLFGIEFVHKPFKGWEYLKKGVGDKSVDFTGGMSPTPERLKTYHMTHPIAERALGLYTLKGSDAILTESDINGRTIGVFTGTITAEHIRKYYPLLSFEIAYADTLPDAVEMLRTGQIDALVVDAVMDPSFDAYDFISSKTFFSLSHVSVSMTTANPDMAPIISVMNKYITAGGIDKLYQLYKEGDGEYARYKLNKSFTEEEKAYLDDLAARNAKVKLAIEHDNYPTSFYNVKDKKFQGIALDVLDQISKLTGIEFETMTTKDTTWADILAQLREGEVSMVTQLLYSDARKNDFIWSAVPYDSSNYALLSKSDFPALETHQIIRSTVGTIEKTAFEDMYHEWFPYSDNTIRYATQNDGLDALWKGEIDLLMASEYMLLTETNYRERSGFKINLLFNSPMNSLFGFNKGETILCSIIDKAQAFVDTKTIASGWSSKSFDYQKKLAEQRSVYLLIFVIFLFLMLLAVTWLFLNNRRLGKNLEQQTIMLTIDNARRKVAEDEALMASKAKSAFLAHMSHEIRTPLNAIIGMSGIAKNSIANQEKALTSINQIISSSHHLLGILNDVLDMSKIESGKLELTHEPFSMIEAYRELHGIIKQRCVEKNISFVTNIDETKEITLVGDKIRVNQVLINLLGNAVKFTAASGRIEFMVHVLEEDEKSIRLGYSVSDNGIGISEENIEKLFEPFEQGDHTIAAKFGGTGLGLSISQSIIKLMGGKIEVESKLNAGTRFSFDLLFEKSDTVIETSVETPDSLDLKGKRILLVEDVEINRIIICEILSPTGVEIYQATDGQEGLNMFKSSAVGYYDLVFMDVQMPVMDGYETTQSIRALEREDAKRVPIVAMTANAYKEDVDRSLDVGMNDHLSKPIDVTAMMRTLRKYLK